MMDNTDNIDTLFSPPRLLLGLSAEQFASLRVELEREIKPTGVIEKIYVNDMAALVCEILGLRRIKIDILRNARPAALENLLRQLLASGRPMMGLDVKMESKRLAEAWFSGDRKKVQEILQKFQLDEGAIEAEAFKLAFPDLQQLDKMLVSMEARFSKALRCISDYRKSFALQVESSTAQILSRNDAPRLEPANDKSAA